ncbi:hypothetical protein [Roseomonas marmotae]|uniref:Class I SAM-dependent methyltransferase n=1 Tax=Roseomonas marmotae TaxID=2768161 RepID=A0ABS3KD19_9PROT|nr:hypothetical protein [Roseomonas marmotae]MBO1074825.1 hypothetical protein [Roseomonas marmotae]QTI80668.1 hypothetical protein IAI58_08070 [Roseomonas marmotae]
MYDNTTIASYGLKDRVGAELVSELDRLVDLAWEPGWAPMALGELIRLCAGLRREAQDWVEVRDLLRSHPMHRLMREDPLVHHADKPAAAWLDLLLGHEAVEPLLEGTSRAGLDLFAVTRALPWMQALRNRTALLTRMADAVATEIRGAEILTLGAGHLREAAAVTNLHRIARWTVLENHTASRRVLYRDQPRELALRTLRCSLRGFARRPYREGCFDLICLPDLPLDWEPAAVQNLVWSAFQVLKPGGRLLLCAPGRPAPEAAWMEIYLNRKPECITARRMEGLLAEIEPGRCASRQVFPSIDGQMMHAILRRA